MTPFSLFDDEDEDEDEDEEEEKELKGVLVQPGASGNSAPAALLSERFQVGEISLVPTDPT